MSAQELIKAELDRFVETMQGFGMRIHGNVERNEGLRDNYTITLTVTASDGSKEQSQYSMNGHALLSTTKQYQTSIIRDRLGRILQALANSEVQS